MFCRELSCSPHPHPAPSLGHPSPGVSNVDRLLPGAACLPQGLNRPVFIKSLEASEGRRCVGRYVSQPGGGGASMILGSLWGHCGGYSTGLELGTEACSGAAGCRLCGSLLSSSSVLSSSVPPAWLPPSPLLFSQTKDDYGKTACTQQAGSANQQMPKATAAATAAAAAAAAAATATTATAAVAPPPHCLARPHWISVPTPYSPLAQSTVCCAPQGQLHL